MTLAGLNDALMTLPVITTKWEGDNRVDVIEDRKRVQLQAVYTIKTTTITLA